jgi:hypothetical protein
MSIQSELTKAIVNSRDLCGNEREAARQVFADHGLRFDEAAYKSARFAANNAWRNEQKAAGVAPKHVLW